MVPAFTRLFKHWKGSATVAGESIEVTAWVEPEPGDELEVAQAQQKRRGGRGKEFGAHAVVKCLPVHQPLTLQQIVARVQAAARAKGAKLPSKRTVQRALNEATDLCLVEHQGRGYTRLETAKE